MLDVATSTITPPKTNLSAGWREWLRSIVSLLFGLVAFKFSPFEPLLVAPLAIAFIYWAYPHVLRFSENYVGPFFLVQFTFLFCTIDTLVLGGGSKVQQAAMGFSFIFGVIGILRNWRYLWTFVPFRLLTGFFLVSTLYFFFYSSDFYGNALSGYSAHVAQGPAGSQDAPAKMAVFLQAASIYFSCTLGLLSFYQHPDRVTVLSRLARFFVLCMVLEYISFFMMGFPRAGNGLDLGVGILFFPMLLISGLLRYLPTQPKMLGLPLGVLLNLTIGLNLVSSVFLLNKTGLPGMYLGVLLFVFLRRCAGIPFRIKEMLKASVSSPLRVFILVSIVCALLTGLLALSPLLSERIHNLEQGYQGQGSLEIRKVNWHYFMEEWKDRLNLVTALFGNGLAKSRETIFFISAQRGGIYLVQTTHNYLMEMFFDYGLLAFLSLGAWISFFVIGIRAVFNKQLPVMLRATGACLPAIVVFLQFYGITDGFKITNTILFFGWAGFYTATLRQFQMPSQALTTLSSSSSVFKKRRER